MIPLLSCGFTGQGRGRVLAHEAPMLTVAAPCIWHGCGTNLSRRQPATTACASTDQARVCLAAPPPASATLSNVADQPFRGERSDTRLRRPIAFWATQLVKVLRAADRLGRVRKQATTS